MFMFFVEVDQKSKKPLLINLDKVRWLQASFVKEGSTVIVFDEDDYLTVDADYEEVCKRIKEVQGNCSK